VRRSLGVSTRGEMPDSEPCFRSARVDVVGEAFRRGRIVGSAASIRNPDNKRMAATRRIGKRGHNFMILPPINMKRFLSHPVFDRQFFSCGQKGVF
jgi:hypothetical protein